MIRLGESSAKVMGAILHPFAFEGIQEIPDFGLIGWTPNGWPDPMLSKRAVMKRVDK